MKPEKGDSDFHFLLCSDNVISENANVSDFILSFQPEIRLAAKCHGLKTTVKADFEYKQEKLSSELPINVVKTSDKQHLLS